MRPEGSQPHESTEVGAIPSLLILDREGVLLEHVEPYILSWKDVRLLPQATETAAAFRDTASFFPLFDLPLHLEG